MIYKSEFPVLYFTAIYRKTDVNFTEYYDWKLYGCKLNSWPDVVEIDSAIHRRKYGYGDNDVPMLNRYIDCVNECCTDFVLKDGNNYVFIRLSPGKWYAMQKSAFDTLFRYTGKNMDELPVFVSYAEPMTSDNEYTVMRPIYDTNNSVTLETKYARLLYPEYADKNCVCKRSTHFNVPSWIQKYTFSLYDDVDFIDLTSEVMFIEGKFGIFNRDDILAFIGMKGRKPIIYVCKDIDSRSLDNKDRVIKEPDPVILPPEEYVNLDTKQIPTIIDVEDVADKGFFNDTEEAAPGKLGC